MNWWVKCSEQTKAFANMTMALKAENPGLILKPFPTCKTCKKWKDIVACEGSCVIITPNGNTIRDVETRPDFFCAGHPDFNPDFGGNNGKDDPIQEKNKEQK